MYGCGQILSVVCDYGSKYKGPARMPIKSSTGKKSNIKHLEEVGVSTRNIFDDMLLFNNHQRK